MSRARELIERVGQQQLNNPEQWDQAFEGQEYPSRVLVEAVALLHQQKNYDGATECIQAALRNDHAFPWMYDALALEMKLANRPQKEIDRVLLSRVDFATNSPQQLLITIALLARFEAWDQAIALCTELTERNPYQSDVWLLIRRYADNSRSPEHILKSRIGILKYAWPEDYADVHAEAKARLQELQQSLEREGHGELASEVRESLAEALERDLQIRIEWAGGADVDLSVTEPGGQVCSFRQRVTANGGLLVNTSDGGRQTDRRGGHVEEYVCRVAASGEYTVGLRLITGRVTTGRVIVEVTQYANTPMERTQRIRVPVGAQDASVKVQLTRGRGQKSAE